MGIVSFFNDPNFSYGLRTIIIESSLAPLTEYLVMPTELIDLYMYMGGNIATKKTENGWTATITSYKDILRTISFPPITFRTFIGRDEKAIKQDAIEYFRSKKLDICNVDNWLVASVL